MRTSSKLFLGALGLLGIGLLVYDLQLVGAFRKGEYRKPFYDYERRPFRNFDRIRLNSATNLNILLVQGDFKVMVNPRLGGVIRVGQVARQLVITAHFPYRFLGSGDSYALYISCPDLKEIETSAQYYIRNKLVNARFAINPWAPESLISGFRLDSIHISQEEGGNLALENDRIGSLQAMVGAGSSLVFKRGNRIGGGGVSVSNGATLNLKDADNLNIAQHLADSATLILNGAAARQLLKSNQP